MRYLLLAREDLTNTKWKAERCRIKRRQACAGFSSKRWYAGTAASAKSSRTAESWMHRRPKSCSTG
jgi:hypothetical protein